MISDNIRIDGLQAEKKDILPLLGMLKDFRLSIRSMGNFFQPFKTFIMSAGSGRMV